MKTNNLATEEAIWQLQDLRKDRESFLESPDPEDVYIRDIEAITMAIAALREQNERENPKPLTLEELRQMDGEPVFLVDLVHKSDPKKADLLSGWIVFFHHLDDRFVPRGHNGWFSVSGYGKTWLAYRNEAVIA